MRVTDIIRNLLNMVDEIESQSSEAPERVTQDDEQGRFYSILKILNAPDNRMLSNAPNEVVTSIDSVTADAGGGVNGPKHPADIRVKDPSPYGK